MVQFIKKFVWCGCGRANRTDADDDNYGVAMSNDISNIIPRTIVTESYMATKDEPSSANFHFTQSNDKLISKNLSGATSPTNRALPELPRLSNTIKENRKNARIAATVYQKPRTDINSDSTAPQTETTNPTYETIDVESDSQSDPIYSKVSRKYDYPIFTSISGAHNEELYQSASQIYADGSEDPYSSINSNCDEKTYYASNAQASGAVHNKSEYMCDAYRRKISLSNNNLDQLYAQIRRHPRSTSIDLQQSASPSPNVQVDYDYELSAGSEMSTSVQFPIEREPSYRYITVREDVEIVRQRCIQLERELELFLASASETARDHYYSSIGSDYESVPSTRNEMHRHDQSDCSSQMFSIQRDRVNPKTTTSPVPGCSSNLGQPCAPKETLSSNRCNQEGTENSFNRIDEKRWFNPLNSTVDLCVNEDGTKKFDDITYDILEPQEARYNENSWSNLVQHKMQNTAIGNLSGGIGHCEDCNVHLSVKGKQDPKKFLTYPSQSSSKYNGSHYKKNKQKSRKFLNVPSLPCIAMFDAAVAIRSGGEMTLQDKFVRRCISCTHLASSAV